MNPSGCPPFTQRDQRRPRPAPSLLVVISDTVDLVLRVHGEGHPVQTLVTDDAAEAAGVVGLPEGLQDLGAERKRPGLRGGYGDGLDGVKEGNTPGRGTPCVVTPRGTRSSPFHLDRGQERTRWERQI